jgi:hypothetical protein
VQLLQAAVKKASEVSHQSKNPTCRWSPWRQIITRSAPPPLLHWIWSMDIEIKAKLIGLGLGREGNLVVGLQLRGQMHSLGCESPPWSQATARGAHCRPGAGPPSSWGMIEYKSCKGTKIVTFYICRSGSRDANKTCISISGG